MLGIDAAGAGACLITDEWVGLELFLEPGKEVLVAKSGDEVAQLLDSLDPKRASRIGDAARARVLAEHTYAHRVLQLEQVLDRFNDPLPALKDFILPGGGPATAACHLARTVVRRAERRVWTLAAAEQVNVEVPRYLNRLSDLLFVIARVLARHEHGSEVLWRHDRGVGR